MGTVEQFHALLNTMGSPVVYHREDGGTPCPCLTPEGFRDLIWHKTHPSDPVCNEAGMLDPDITNASVQAAIQPLRGFRVPERAVWLLGEIQTDDQIGIFPVTWGSTTLDFSDWDDSGKDYVLYDGRRFICINSDKLPDIDGNPDHHWETGLRLVKNDRPTD